MTIQFIFAFGLLLFFLFILFMLLFYGKPKKESLDYAISHLEKHNRKLKWIHRNRPNDFVKGNINQLEIAIKKLRNESI